MDLSKARILVVDDEPELREIFSRWLFLSGCRSVSTATDGAEALALMNIDSFDLLITDVRMPVVDGITLVRQLSVTPGPIPTIIMVSGFSHIDEREMYATGVEAFLPKPLDRDDLIAAVIKALSKRS
jgi:CheY-like chemotaxis protein